MKEAHDRIASKTNNYDVRFLFRQQWFAASDCDFPACLMNTAGHSLA
jgi:hypothetical protein